KKIAIYLRDVWAGRNVSCGIGVSFSLRRSFDRYLLPSMASESSRIGLFTNAEVTTSGRPVLRRNEVECFLPSSVDLDSEDDPPRFTSLRSYHTDENEIHSSSVASSSKVVYPDTAQMIVYDPTKKSEFSSSVKPMAASASNTFQSNVTATATHVSANTFDEIPKTTPPALLAFLANLPHIDGKFLKPVPSD
ncbi:hypothetical protein HID58_088400, partial [Brassica napus]